jgi:hypothetical protein
MPTISELLNNSKLPSGDTIEGLDGIPMYDNSQDKTVGVPADRFIQSISGGGGSSNYVVSVSDFGADPSSSNNTTEIQSAIDNVSNNGGGIVYIPEGIFRVNRIQVKSKVSILGGGRGVSELRPITSGHSGDSILYASNIKDVKISDLSIINDQNNTIPYIDFNTGNNDIIERFVLHKCYFESTQATQNGVIIGGKIKDLVIAENVSKQPTIKESLRAHIRIRGTSTPKTSNPISILNNRMEGGDCGIRMSTDAYGPTHIENNLVHKFQVCGYYIHAPMPFRFAFNTAKNGTAASLSNNDGGAIWLDSRQSTNGREDYTVFGNTAKDIEGNGFYFEEFISANVIGNHAIRCTERPDDIYSVTFTYGDENSSSTFTSDGGYGFLVTGGCWNTSFIGNRAESNTFGLMVSRPFGVHEEFDIRDLTFQGNSWVLSEKWGIEMFGKIGLVHFHGDRILGNGESQSSTYGGVHLYREGTNNKWEQAHFSNVIISSHQNGSGQQYHGIKSTYDDGAIFKVQDSPRFTNSGGDLIDWEGQTSKVVITGNDFVNGGNINVGSPPRKVIARNEGYTTDGANTQSIADGDSSVTVYHGLSQKPKKWHINISPFGSQNGAGTLYIDPSSISSDSFIVETDTPPSGGSASFVWQVNSLPFS